MVSTIRAFGIAQAVVALALVVGSAQAAIMVVETGAAETADNSAPGDFTLSAEGPGTRDGIYSVGFNAGASFDMLVVTVSRESSAAINNTNNATFGVSYNNVSMNLATGATDGSGVSIFYLATTGTTGSKTIALDFTDFAAVNGIGIGIAAIKSSTGDPIGLYDADSGSGTSISIDTADDSFTMWAVDTNGQGSFNNLPAVQIIKDQDIGSNGYAAAYELVTTGQVNDSYAYTYTGTIDSSTGPRGIAAANFEVIPEPASLALLAAGGLLIASRRR